MVRIIAETATPHVVSEQERAMESTVGDMIERLCGSVQDGYIDELSRANGGISINLDASLRDPTAPARFPACLYVYDNAGTGSKIEIAVQAGDNAATIFERLTGKKPTDKQLTEYFGLPMAKLSTLHAGDILRPQYITQPVFFTVSGPNSMELIMQLSVDIEAAKGVEKIANGELPSGHVVMPIESGLASTHQLKCSFSSAPLDGAAIKNALEYSRSKEKPTMEADVMIVDNGFLGADPNNGMFANSPFDERLFMFSSDGTLELAYDLVEWRLPIANRGAQTDPSIYGHGTHVAGLALGGPDFPARGQQKWDVLQNTVRLTILNVADATHLPFDGAAKAIANSIVVSRPWIVNMSLAYDGAGNNPSADGVRSTFAPLVQTRPLSLFVVAAGNDGGAPDVRETYPAVLGGADSENVITVGALDGNGRIAPFSNRGDKVDVVAPGCMIESWTDNSSALTRLSGTSQSAPQVTFLAALIRHLLQRADPFDIKARLVASGDLLAPEDRKSTAFGVAVNPVAAMFVFDDYVQKINDTPLLGEVIRVDGLQCPPKYGDTDRKEARHLWSIKRWGVPLFLFGGKNLDALDPPCEAIVSDDSRIIMRPTKKVVRGRVEPWAGPIEISIPMKDIANVVFASKEQ
jgi:hypothetical protein